MVAGVLAPASVDELGGQLRDLDAHHRMMIRGLGSTLPSDDDRIVVDTMALNRFVHRVDDFSVTVGAGVLWSALQEQLARVGQRVAVDPPGVGTVGAMVATGARGGLIHRYGGVRDQIIGMTIVLADGTVAHSGSTVIKNVAGYDLAKLFAGSRGRFGIIAEVIFRTRPLPETQRTLLVPARPDRVRALVHEILGAHVELSALDLVDDTLSCLVEGGHEVIDRRLDRLMRALPDTATERLDEPQSLAYWSRLRDLQFPVEGGLVFSLSARSTVTLDLLPMMRSTLGSSLAALVAHVGAGVVEVSVAPGGQAHRLLELREMLSCAAGEIRARHPLCSFDFEIPSSALVTHPPSAEARAGSTITVRLLADRIGMALDPNGRFR
ncbi:FAD-binding oxidoreductase [Ferrimicrobium sp.]|uniref:FAD-binding oxidoreductase n=1 Tax=Ferrimicrobium sp. TaxID=2926050 RepID=UPI00262D1D3F|nr:FAD-binding oxidoreductase [Ferrimicrobium sp.]